jgi:hypothetical protein
MTTKIEVKRTNKNYGFALSGKIGSKPELEEDYVRHFTGRDAGGKTKSLRDVLKEAYADGKCTPEEWDRVVAAQAKLAAIREKLLAAGYTMADMMKLTLDNS